MIILPDMMSWPHFVQLPQIKNLSLHEQTQRYNYYLMEQQALYQQIMVQHAVGSGGSNTSSGPTPVTLAFEISSESGTNVLISLATKIDKSVDVTYEWDDMGLVSAGSVSETISANSTSTPTIDLEAGDTNVPFRIILSDASAIQNLTWTASDDDVGPNQYQIWTSPTNFSSLEGVSLAAFEFQSVSSLDISNVVANSFRWLIDTSITSANLTNVNVNGLRFDDCSSLSTLTLTGLVFGNSEGGYSFNFSGCALTEETVNALLIAAAASGYENGIIDISGGTNSTFNGAEAGAAYDTLIARSWTITDNE